MPMASMAVLVSVVTLPRVLHFSGRLLRDRVHLGLDRVQRLEDGGAVDLAGEQQHAHAGDGGGVVAQHAGHVDAEGLGRHGCEGERHQDGGAQGDTEQGGTFHGGPLNVKSRPEAAGGCGMRVYAARS
ncbi:hypothetical protein [Rugamonas sp. DEMB1]|uniref:hypothetical protein n=1 Tax=Rugamonas sp. DEMB1 TaxID=3039386 RepID=UPI00244BB5A4|nr:hypothetical protein [Rugamonas sp. DEMB1]WGG48930.1 hypothetical protein QC826_20090 [Rugamonas sp. DEMB1]